MIIRHPILQSLAVILILICSGLLFVSMLFNHYWNDFTQANNETKQNILLIVEPGFTLTKTAHLLKEKNLINQIKPFIVMGKLLDVSNEIKSGEYKFSTSQSPAEILKQLITGSNVWYSTTIPEGLTVQETGQRWANSNVCTLEDFLTNLRTYTNQKISKPATGWEGYLFPDTYRYSRGLTSSGAIQLMVSEFIHRMKPEWIEAGAKHDLNLHQIVTLASLIEKETRQTEERQLISSVFHNRLKSGMLLQCDPTVIFALGDSYKGRLLKSDLKIDNPYNTYVYPGLPPGPIANPGEESLYAACFPAETQFKYFVVKEEGWHEFNRTLSQHNQAVKNYRKLQRRLRFTQKHQ